MNGMDCIYCDGELSRVIIVNTFLQNTIDRYEPGLYIFECIECKRKVLFKDGERTKILHGMEAVEYLYKKMIERDKILFGEILVRTDITVLGPDTPCGCLRIDRDREL